jgi:hypothetical protein
MLVKCFEINPEHSSSMKLKEKYLKLIPKQK